MKESNQKYKIIVMLPVLLFLNACSGFGSEQEKETVNTPAEDYIYIYTDADQNTKPGQAEQIDLAEGEGVVTISEGGEYLLSGETDGQILVDAYEDEMIHLYLNNAVINSASGPAIYVKSAAKLIITLMPESENVLADTANYKGYEELKACLYSTADITINGEGSLAVYGYYEDGLRSKDRIKIAGGSLEIWAKGDGIRGNDGFAMKAGRLNIQSEANGIRTVNNQNTRGIIELSGGEIDIISGKNGIDSANDIYMRNCSCTVYSVQKNVNTSADMYIDEGCLQ